MPASQRWIAFAIFGIFVALGVSAAPTPSIDLLSPVDGQALIAGRDAELAWEPATPEPGAAREEWEAFLSLDGGRTWPVRITPHLDWQVRRTTFRVPPLPSREVRLLLRVGNEREEIAVPLAARLTIEGVPDLATLLTVARSSPTAGEAALPGGQGVRLWVEGPRDGAWRQQVTAGAPSDLTSGHQYFFRFIPVDLTEAPLAPPFPQPGGARLDDALPLPRSLGRARPPARPTGRQLRSLLTQRNE